MNLRYRIRTKCIYCKGEIIVRANDNLVVVASHYDCWKKDTSPKTVIPQYSVDIDGNEQGNDTTFGMIQFEERRN
jgi:hypothetical protein